MPEPDCPSFPFGVHPPIRGDNETEKLKKSRYDDACFVLTNERSRLYDAINRRVDQMVNDEMYNLFYEDALVQMIFQKNFELYYKDIKDFKWTEVDCVDDLLKARQIQAESEK